MLIPFHFHSCIKQFTMSFTSKTHLTKHIDCFESAFASFIKNENEYLINRSTDLFSTYKIIKKSRRPIKRPQTGYKRIRQRYWQLPKRMKKTIYCIRRSRDIKMKWQMGFFLHLFSSYTVNFSFKSLRWISNWFIMMHQRVLNVWIVCTVTILCGFNSFSWLSDISLYAFNISIL
jgi:hypothetical protein